MHFCLYLSVCLYCLTVGHDNLYRHQGGWKEPWEELMYSFPIVSLCSVLMFVFHTVCSCWCTEYFLLKRYWIIRPLLFNCDFKGSLHLLNSKNPGVISLRMPGRMRLHHVSLFVYFVSRIMQKILNWLALKLVEGCSTGKGRSRFRWFTINKIWFFFSLWLLLEVVWHWPWQMSTGSEYCSSCKCFIHKVKIHNIFLRILHSF